VAIHSHHLEGDKDKQGRLVVNLARKAMGRVALAVQFQRDLQEPKLLSPLGPVEIPLGLPQVPAAAADRATGRLVIYAPESLRVNPSKAEGLRAVPLKEALEGMPWALAPNRPEAAARGDLQPKLPFTFGQEPVVLRLAVERQKPYVTVRQLVVGRIEEGMVKYQDTLSYSILYSGLKSLRIDVPADVAGSLHTATSGIQDKRLDPQPDDVAKGMVAWSLGGENELLGEGKIELTWDKSYAKLEVGKEGIDLVLRPLVPYHADHSWGQIVLGEAETLHVETPDEPPGLQPIDPQHDLKTEVAGGARAFQFPADAWTLPFTVTRYELKEIKRTSIDRAVVRMVLTPAERVTAVQALYRIRSARQQLAIELPEGANFDADPLRLNGQPVAMGQGKNEGQFLVPLLGTNADEPFLLELRYTVSGGGRLALPVFREGSTPEEGPAVQQVYLCVFVPQTQALLGTSGPWAEEFAWMPYSFLHWVPVNKIGDQQLVPWVRDGVKDPGSSAETFHTDGTQYVFSTLRPPPDGPLAMHTVDHRGLSGLVFAFVLLGGLALAAAGWSRRVLALGGLISVVVLAGVFLPTLSIQVFNDSFAAAVFIVLVVWAVVSLLRLSPAVALAGRAMAAGWRRVAAPPKQPPPAAPPASQPGPSAGGPGNA
jgi:hypothetical protein